MSVTIRDVAKLAGVSPSTVSRTCNDHPSISEETKAKVREAIAKTGYIVPATSGKSRANNHRNNKMRHMGIILPPTNTVNYENTFHLRAIRGISRYCTAHDYSSTVIAGDSRHEILSIVQRMVEQKDVEGFIFLYSSTNDPVIRYLHDIGITYVLIGKASDYANNTVYVDNDNLMAGQDATDYLLALNHINIGYIGYGSDFLFSYERQSGYQLAIMRRNIPFRPDYIVNNDSFPLTEEGAVARLLNSPDRPTGLVIADDSLAVAVMQLCFKLGLNIPNDISIISFNNSLMSLLSSPQLTSIDVNSIQLGETAAALLVDHIESNTTLATKTIVPHKLVERLSATWCDR